MDRELYYKTKHDFDLYNNRNIFDIYYNCLEQIPDDIDDDDEIKKRIREQYDQINLKAILGNILTHAKLKLEANECFKLVFNVFDKLQWPFEDSLSQEELEIYHELCNIDYIIFKKTLKQ